MFYCDRKTIRDEKNDEILVDFSDFDNIMIHKEITNYEVEVIDDIHFYLLKIRKK